MNGSNPGWFEGRIHKLKTLLIDGWTKYQLFEWIIGQTNGWLVSKMNKWKNKQVQSLDGQKYEQTYRWFEGESDGQQD